MTRNELTRNKATARNKMTTGNASEGHNANFLLKEFNFKKASISPNPWGVVAISGPPRFEEALLRVSDDCVRNQNHSFIAFKAD
jgi:hypothetical protein